jgi:hypothetical protein
MTKGDGAAASARFRECAFIATVKVDYRRRVIRSLPYTKGDIGPNLAMKLLESAKSSQLL